jgi:hypothetical protein
MPDRNEYAHGTPSWIDVQTTDQGAAKRFYGQLFGWSYDDQPMDDGGAVYSMATLRDRAVAAVAPLPPGVEGIPPHWNTYVTVADVDATAARVPDAGGMVLMPPFDVLDAGRMAFVADPTGAPIAFWQAKNHIGAQIVNEPGTLCWNELHTPDVARAAAFYGGVLGWGTQPFGDGGDYTVFTVGDDGVAGAMPPPMEGVPASWMVYFAVADSDATAQLARDLGATVLAEPFDIPVGRVATLADPQGAVFAVIRLAEMP